MRFGAFITPSKRSLCDAPARSVDRSGVTREVLAAGRLMRQTASSQLNTSSQVPSRSPTDFAVRTARRNPLGGSSHCLLNAIAVGTAKGALPDCQLSPSELREQPCDLRVTFDVAPNLGTPEPAVCARQAKQRAVVSVPKASVHEKRRAVARQDKIRPTGDVCRVQAEPKPETVKGAADQSLGPGITTANAAHHAAPRRPVDDVGHYAT